MDQDQDQPELGVFVFAVNFEVFAHCGHLFNEVSKFSRMDGANPIRKQKVV